MLGFGTRVGLAAYGCMSSAAVSQFWMRCRESLCGLSGQVPDAWAFGATAEQADALLALVLDGTKTGTASALWDYEEAGDPVPAPGTLSIVLNGRGDPRALLRTTSMRIVPFDQVDAAHAFAEGEGDRSLGYWRQAHELFWREHSENPHGFKRDMPVVCELFEVLYPETVGGLGYEADHVE